MRGWPARIRIELARRAGATRLSRVAQSGPLYLQKALYPEGPNPAHLYLLHPPGGVVQGDTLDVEVNAGADSQALITTPAAGKIYRTPQAEARQTFTIRAAPGACVEWLPQETIVFDGARARTTLGLDISATSHVIAWDIVVLGRPASERLFNIGHVGSRLRVTVDDVPLLIESSRIPGAAESDFMSAAYGLGGRGVFGTLVAYPGTRFDNKAMDALRELGADDDGYGITDVDGVLVVRHLATTVAAVRDRLTAAWRILRPPILGRDPVWPRIWST